ncbi:hypothetical protein ABEB36_013902 [Hypothenemus hampei]|uniref:Uncharacterized protein n=1 Tax=Hypothenemus hampei TaxID=57062 RepID=A0ABD1E5M4_HYPHA
MIKSRSKLLERQRLRKQKILIYSLNLSSALYFFCAVYQTIQLMQHCGRDFRLSHLWDAYFEQCFMTYLEICLSSATFIGLWTKRGSAYFLAMSFCICTTMIQHFVDILMGIIYVCSYGTDLKAVQAFLEKNYKNYKLGQFFSIQKINRIHNCHKCCGIEGVEDSVVRYDNNTLIPDCCPSTITTTQPPKSI